MSHTRAKVKVIHFRKLSFWIQFWPKRTISYKINSYGKGFPRVKLLGVEVYIDLVHEIRTVINNLGKKLKFYSKIAILMWVFYVTLLGTQVQLVYLGRIIRIS